MMAVMTASGDEGMLRIWGTIAELSEQLTQHRAFTASLQAQISLLKSQAIHSQTGFPLRRFNLDKSKEEYEAELERMTVVMMNENQELQHDNKQLNALIKEYEQTLESVMTTFRNRAHEVQERELALIRGYEARLIARETDELEQRLDASTAASAAIARMSALLRATLRALGGEDADVARRVAAGQLEDAEGDDGEGAEGSADEEWSEGAVAEWALERESELARLERENEELRRMAGEVAEGGGGGGQELVAMHGLGRGRRG